MVNFRCGSLPAAGPTAGNNALAYHLTSTLPMFMGDVQARLRERFQLPAWNVMHECADMVGDTDGLVAPDEMDAQEHADFVRLAVTNPLLTCKWCNQSFETYITEGGPARLSCPHCKAGLGS